MKKQARAKKLTEVRLGVIGVGNMGTSHIKNIENGLIKRARLTAVCDIVPEKMDIYGDKYLKFTDSRELIRSGEVDAVMIETPHYDHTTIGIDALTQGLHTLVEKPISVHKADCERLIAAHKDKKVVFSAMFNQRTDPHYIKLREIIQSGQLGEITRVNWIITTWFRPQAYYDGGGWRGGQTADFFLQCRWYADQGFVAVSADYRLADRKLSRESMTHTLQDAVSAIRYARKHAAELGIDPTKVVASGSSAGGHLSLAISLFSDYNDPADDLTVSPVPNALVLLCPVIDCGPPPGYQAAYRWMKEYYLPFSPFQNVKKGMPPQIIVLGTLDHVTPPAHAEAYQKKVRELGNVCELKLFPDVKHGAFYRGKHWTAAQPIIEEFLKKQGLWP